MKKPKFICFDWDKTLANTSNMVRKSINIVLSNYNLPEWNIIKKQKRDPNKSLKENFINFFGENDYRDAYKMYLEDQFKNVNKVKAMPFAESFLEILDKDKDINILIISNKERKLLLYEINVLFPTIHFFKIMANGDSIENKPSSSPIYEALKNYEINIENVWMIGDSNQDIDCALNAAVRPVLIGNGGIANDEYYKDIKKRIPELFNFDSIEELTKFWNINFK